MEINGWDAVPKEDGPQLRKARMEWYLGFRGPGGFATTIAYPATAQPQFYSLLRLRNSLFSKYIPC